MFIYTIFHHFFFPTSDNRAHKHYISVIVSVICYCINITLHISFINNYLEHVGFIQIFDTVRDDLQAISNIDELPGLVSRVLINKNYNILYVDMFRVGVQIFDFFHL